MRTIDRTSPVPIYHQLRRLIEGRIEKGVWRPGDRIPTERELCETYGISRSPVRQALGELAQDGLVVRKPGLGTFITNHVSHKSSTKIPVRMMCSDPNWSLVLDHVSGVWNARHPDSTITFDIEVVPHPDFYDLLRAAVGSGTAPDLAMVDSVWVAGLADAGFLHALENLGPPGDPSGFGEDRYPASIEANSLDNHLYGVPVKADVSLLWYRQDWFAQEGLTPPADWNDLLEAAEHFLQPTVQRHYGLKHPLAFPGGTAGGEATVYSLMPFVWSAGGSVFDAETTCVTLNSPDTWTVLEYLRELVQRRVSSLDIIGYANDTSSKLFAEGKVAMALGGSYEAELMQAISSWSEEEFVRRVGATAPPAAPGSEPVPTMGGTSYVVLRQCEQPSLMTALLNVATDPAVIGDLYRSMWLNLPSPSFNVRLSQEAESLATQMSKLIASGRARPSISEYVKVSRQLQAMFEAAVSGSEPVDDIAQRAGQFIGVIAELPCRSA